MIFKITKSKTISIFAHFLQPHVYWIFNEEIVVCHVPAKPFANTNVIKQCDFGITFQFCSVTKTNKVTKTQDNSIMFHINLIIQSTNWTK